MSFLLRLFYLILFCISCTHFCFSQETINVLSTGRSITRDLSPEEAKFKAIDDAKLNALRNAGIIENINVTGLLYTKQSAKEFFQDFDEISSSEINGAIIVDSIINEKRTWDNYNNMIIDVEISSTVFKYSTIIDPSFLFKVEGLNDNYKVNESISFKFTPSQNGFLRIFIINKKESSLLYPFDSPTADYLDDQKDCLFVKDKTVNFPIHPAYKHGYSIRLDSDSENEINTMIFVFSKKNIPFYQKQIKIIDIFRWIYSIPIDQRILKSITINVSR